MKASLARILVQLYSSEWRSRYEKEFVEFLAEIPLSPAMICDVAISGIRESMTRRLRRRADAFRGVVLVKRRSLAQIGGMLLAITAFSLVAEANPRWMLHRTLEDFRIWPGDSRIRYELGAEDLAAAVSAAIPSALASAEFVQSGTNLHRPVLIYVCANEKNANALRRSARLNPKEERIDIFISSATTDPRSSVADDLMAQWHELCAANQPPIVRAR